MRALYADLSRPANMGHVARVGDGVAEIEGLAGAKMSEMLKFNKAHGKSLKDAVESEQEIFGVVLNLEEESVRAIILGDTGNKVTERAWRSSATGEVLSLPVGDDALLGRVDIAA